VEIWSLLNISEPFQYFFNKHGLSSLMILYLHSNATWILILMRILPAIDSFIHWLKIFSRCLKHQKIIELDHRKKYKNL
jgi:uncharacterized protein YybS (DUF2232 family)